MRPKINNIQSHCCSKRVFDNPSEFAIAAEIITVNASNPSQVSSLLDRKLSDILENVTCRLNLHLLTQRTFTDCLELTRRLIENGKLCEISLFQSNLRHESVVELFDVFSRCHTNNCATNLIEIDNDAAIETVDDEACVSEDLYDMAVLPASYSAAVEQMHRDNVGIGLQALSLVNYRYDGTEFNQLLHDTLRSWNALKKLAIVETTGIFCVLIMLICCR